MIIMRLFGGLGNQMFQYALARHLSLIHNTDILLEPSALANDDTAHVHFKLDVFSLNPHIVKVLDSSYTNQLYSQFNRYHTPTFSFNPEVFNVADNTILSGDWQSEHYFSGIRPVLLQEFKLKNPLREELRNWENAIKQTHSVSLHIRRGDYLSSEYKEKFGILPISYYADAISYLEERFENLNIFVFSDDIEWAKENLQQWQNSRTAEQQNSRTAEQQNSIIHYFNQSKDNHQEEEIYLMSCCKHNIIANSTFSWWAAWLNNYQGKTVIAPKQWFLTKEIDTSGIVPKSWVKINNELVV